MEASCFHPSSLFDQAERWFHRAGAALLGEIPCAKGCCQCCIGTFPITLLDVEHMRRGITRLPPEQRARIETRARSQVSEMEAAYPSLRENPILDNWPDEQIDELVHRFAASPCPALQEDGACGLYEFRPVTCRTMGIPEKTGDIITGACDVQSFVPIVRLSETLRDEEDRLVEQEASLLQIERLRHPLQGDEVLLPYGFIGIPTAM